MIIWSVKGKQRCVKRTPSGGPWGQGLFNRFAFVDEALSREQLGARDCVGAGKRV